MTTPTRRRFLTEPGDQLLMIDGPIEFVRRFDDMVEASGIDSEDLLATPVVGVPLPIAKADGDGNPTRFANAKPEFMWHPLMWLPKRVALRFEYHPVDTDGRVLNDITEMESDDVWAVRVALELQASGLYDPDTGTWLDVLAFFGLDAENPVDLARVGAWLAGEADETLDAIDPSILYFVDENDPEWALRAAQGLVETLVPAEWSVMAAAIVLATRGQLEVTADPQSRHSIVTVMSQIAAHVFRGVPTDPTTGVDYFDVIGSIMEDLRNKPEETDELGEELMAVLEDIHLDYQPSVAALNIASTPDVTDGPQ